MRLPFHFFIPHEINNFRAKSLHFSFLAFYIAAFLFLQTSFRLIKFSRPDILGFATDINTEKLLNLTNLARAQAGLEPLNLDMDLSEAAKLKAADMFAKNYWAHSAPDGTPPWKFITKANYQYVYAGENLARDFNSSESVISAWLASPSHKENILKKEYRDIGFAIINGKLAGEDTTLVVQFFGSHQPGFISQKTNQTVSVSASSIKVNGVTNLPKINFFSANKNLAVLMTGILLFILFFDALFIWRRRIIRMTSHNLAHLIFLLFILGALWITSQGAIL